MILPPKNDNDVLAALTTLLSNKTMKVLFFSKQHHSQNILQIAKS